MNGVEAALLIAMSVDFTQSQSAKTLMIRWEILADLAVFRATVQTAQAKSIFATDDSPDLSFDQSINPYRGCEHGNGYCYARPSHAHMGLWLGLDFETRIFANINAFEL